MPCADITNLAQSIWNDLGQPTDTSTSYIQSKLVSNAFIGKLNNLIFACFSGVSGDITPPLSTDQLGIYASLYEVDYWTTKLNTLLNGNDLSWTTLQDGDSRITRVSAVEQGRLYRDMQKQLMDQLNRQILAYNLGNSAPNSVDYPNIAGPIAYNGCYGIGGPTRE